MGCDAGFYDIFAGILPSGHGAVRIGFHERRIAGHVGGQYRRKPFVNLPLRHVLPFGRSIAGYTKSSCKDGNPSWSLGGCVAWARRTAPAPAKVIAKRLRLEQPDPPPDPWAALS
jgi:hypothetical protein